MTLAVLPMMAQDEYPKYIDGDYEYIIDGEVRQVVTSNMLKQIMEQESLIHPYTLDGTARRWYSNGWEGSPTGWGYDTIARFSYKNHKPIQIDAHRLDTGEYKDALWSIRWERTEVAPGDTAKSFTFDHNNISVLKFYSDSAVSYTAYAGRPYSVLEPSNPLNLPLNYQSSDTTVANVDPRNGKITVKGKAGETTISVSFDGDERIGVGPQSDSYRLIVKKGDHFSLSVMSLERSEHTWGGGGTYLGFDMIEVNEDNCSDIYGNGQLSFDIESRTLTFNNFQRIFTEEEDQSMGWMDWLDYSSGPLPLNIKVVGNCCIRHNSAGIFCGYDLNILGDGEDQSFLTLEGRFPQLSAENITVDGVQVHALASTPHPLMICNKLRVEDNSYYEAHMEIEVGPGEDPAEWGAMVAQIEEVEFGENIIMLTKDVHVDHGKFVDGQGKTALRVEIGPKMEEVIAEDINFSAVELTDDPTGTEIDGVLYTLGENDLVDKEEGCLVINSAMNMEEVSSIVDQLTPGSAAFAEQYYGLTFLLPVGKGSINIEMQTSGAYQLAVQIGKNEPVLLTQSTKGSVQIPFDLSIATFAYIYAVGPVASGAPGMRRLNASDSEGSVKLFSLKLIEGTEGIDEVAGGQAQSTKRLRDGLLIIEKNGKVYNALGTEVK